MPNHTSDRHPRARRIAPRRTSPKRDWYIWRDPKPDGSLPNNKSPYGPAWTLDEATGQYYLHQFLKEQPELNWRNPEVQAAMHDVLRFWFKRGVSGFRIDVVGFLIKDADLRDNPPNPDADPNLPPEDIYGRQNRIYTEHQPEVFDLIHEFRRLADGYGDTCLIGEVWHNDFNCWLKYYGENGAGLHLPFNFGLMGRRWRARDLQVFVDQMDGQMPAWAWPNQVLGSHDAPRIASRVGAAQAPNAAMCSDAARHPIPLLRRRFAWRTASSPAKGSGPQGLVVGGIVAATCAARCSGMPIPTPVYSAHGRAAAAGIRRLSGAQCRCPVGRSSFHAEPVPQVGLVPAGNAGPLRRQLPLAGRE